VGGVYLAPQRTSKPLYLWLFVAVTEHIDGIRAVRFNLTIGPGKDYCIFGSAVVGSNYSKRWRVVYKRI